MFPKLNLPDYLLKIKENQVWDPLRKKYLKITPEEWVRQNFIQYLIEDKNFSAGLMVSEHIVEYNGMKKRCDIAIFNQEMSVDVIVECKAPEVALTEETFYQIAKYTRILQAPILILTNGLNHYCAFVDVANNEMRFLKKIPSQEELKDLIS